MRLAHRTAARAARDYDGPYRPRWLRFTPFLGRPPELTQRQWLVLGLVSVATLFDQYDRALFALALPQIQRGLKIAEVNVGYLASIVRLGALPAFLVALAADRLGRRRVLLFTILVYTALTGATALAPDARTFVALQFLAAIFTSAEVLLAIVVITEEFDPETRGWGIGALFAIQACGVGLAAALLPLVEVTGIGWRALYLVGLGPLLMVAYWRRALPETERFERERRVREIGRQTEYALQPIVKLVRAYPGRFAAIGAVVFLFALGGSAADFLGPKYLQDQHGWKPSQVAVLYILGGMLGLVGATFAGRLSDRIGRKTVTIASCVGVSVLAISFYNASGIALSPLWIVLIFTLIGNNVMLSAYGAEMFPTSYRSTAAGARLIVATVGGVIGLALESVLYRVLQSHWTAVSLLMAISLLAPLIVALTFPETAGRSLEEIAPER
jgi:MFS family permease